MLSPISCDSYSDGADLDEWIKRLANDIDASFPPGPSRDALYDVVKELTARYEDFKLQLFGPTATSLEAQWDLACKSTTGVLY